MRRYPILAVKPVTRFEPPGCEIILRRSSGVRELPKVVT